MSGEGGAIAEVAFDALDAKHDQAYHVHAAECCWPIPDVTAVLADLLAAERQRGREEALREAAKEAEERGDIGKDGGCEAWDWLSMRAEQAAGSRGRAVSPCEACPFAGCRCEWQSAAERPQKGPRSAEWGSGCVSGPDGGDGTL